MKTMNWMNLFCFRGIVIVLFVSVTTPLPAKETKGKDEIVLGMSTALSGPAADLGKNMKQGVLVGLERANRAGGIHGRSLKLIALDDGYEPTRTAPNMRKLIEQKGVLAVIGNVGTPTAIAAVPIANEQKTLLFAPFTGAGVLRKNPPDRYVINYRASYAEETAAMIDALIKTGKLKTDEIAFFTQRDGYGDAGFIGGIKALKRHGLQDENTVVHARYERNTLAVENGLANILIASPPPRAIIMVGAYAPCAKFIKLSVESGFEAVFLNVSFVGSAPLARELGNMSSQVIVTQVVPHPQEKDLSIVEEYHADLLKQYPSASPTFGSLEGYIASRIFIQALENIKGQPDRENVIDALESLGDFTIGLGHSLHLTQDKHQASHHVWPTILRKGDFVPFQWKAISAILKAKK
jgi:ABC-type branched-subunit amino acid transport system substrate-binding protein